jgi:hypothetical protein
MSYKKVISRISHWHEHEIHDRMSEILGYSTWRLGKPMYVNGRQSHEELDLHLEFDSREDYERCVAAIIEARNINPVGTCWEEK